MPTSGCHLIPRYPARQPFLAYHDGVYVWHRSNYPGFRKASEEPSIVSRERVNITGGLDVALETRHPTMGVPGMADIAGGIFLRASEVFL